MKVAVVGTGISGLAAARMLSGRHQVTVFEANAYIGGHTNTIPVAEGARTVPVDTGFIVFNRPNYPNLCRLFNDLGVRSRETDMSFSVTCEASGLEYGGSSLDTLFAQRSNLVNLGHWRMLKDILRFNREAPELLRAGLTDELTVSQFLVEHGYSRAFGERYLTPLGASLWSASGAVFERFPIRFVIEFLQNHCMLQVNGRPQWMTVIGGSSSYIAPLTAPFADRIRLNTPVTRVERQGSKVSLGLGGGEQETFDEVVLACHADQALNMLQDPDPTEHDLLRAFPYSKNVAVLHTDTRLLPESRKLWSSWNYYTPAEARERVSVTYYMNRLQGLEAEGDYCVSLNPVHAPDPASVIASFDYDHPVFSIERQSAQGERAQMLRRRGISYCGAYWGYGFHEDGLRSALDVGGAFDLDLAA